jgi:hypothetical protein
LIIEFCYLQTFFQLSRPMATQGASPQDGNQRLPVAPPAYQIAKDDAVAAWQAKPRVLSRWLDTYVNYMVLGTHGFTRASQSSRIA